MPTISFFVHFYSTFTTMSPIYSISFVFSLCSNRSWKSMDKSAYQSNVLSPGDNSEPKSWQASKSLWSFSNCKGRGSTRPLPLALVVKWKDFEAGSTCHSFSHETVRLRAIAVMYCRVIAASIYNSAVIPLQYCSTGTGISVLSIYGIAASDSASQAGLQWCLAWFLEYTKYWNTRSSREVL